MDGGDGVGMVAGKPGSHSGPEVAAVGGVAGVAKPVVHQTMPELGNLAGSQAIRWRRGGKAEAGKRGDHDGERVRWIPTMRRRVHQERQELTVFEERTRPTMS